MTTLRDRFARAVSSSKFGILLFCCFALLTAGAVIVLESVPSRGGAVVLPPAYAASASPSDDSRDVVLSGMLSQYKVVQGDDGTLYLNVAIEPPLVDTEASERRPTDMIVVLDRSGSMSAGNKLPYAKSAIHDLLSRLRSDDRFALISFDDVAVVHANLTVVNGRERERLHRIVRNLHPGGSTNIGEGLAQAKMLLAARESDRSERVILLSDGHANQGMTSQRDLAGLAAQLTDGGAVLSTIGMGLSFNESLMACIADHGMGNYTYLEDLESLGAIFANDLSDSREVYASHSELLIDLANGVQIVDAGGYPISRSGSTIRIPTGQLLSGSKKAFDITFRAPTATVAAASLGSMRLEYVADGQRAATALPAGRLAYEIVEPSRRHESYASMDAGLLRRVWSNSTLGKMQSSFGAAVASNDKERAQAAISEYRRKREEFAKATGISLANENVDRQITVMEQNLDDAFSGTLIEQRRNQLGVSKWSLSESLANSRYKK